MGDGSKTGMQIEVLGRLVHDLNNHLTIVLTWIEYAQDELPEDSPVTVYLRDAQAAAEKAGELAAQILPTAGGRQMPPPA